jgi:transposase
MPVPLRTDFDAAALRAIARQTKDGPQARRLLALAAIYEGATRTEAARIGGVTGQIVRDWVGKFNAHGPEGLVNRKPPGQPSKLTDAHRAALQAIVEQGPIPAIHGVVRWRLIDLIAWIWEEFRISISKQTLSRELRAMTYRKLSARPRHHAKNEAAVAAFKKTSRPVWRSLRRPRPAASPSRSGSPMRRGSGRRTRSPAVGLNAAPARQPPRTKGPPRPISLGPSVRLKARARAWFCPAAPPRA